MTAPSRPFSICSHRQNCLGIGAGQAGRLDESRRIHIEIEQIPLCVFGRHRDRRAVAVDGPRIFAVGDVGLPHVLLERRSVDPAEPVLPDGGIQAGRAVEGLFARLRVPVDGAGVVGHRIDPRPVDVDRVLICLADRTAIAGTGERDTLEVCFANLLGGGRQQWRGIDVAGRELLGEHQAAHRDEHGEQHIRLLEHFASCEIPDTPRWSGVFELHTHTAKLHTGSRHFCAGRASAAHFRLDTHMQHSHSCIQKYGEHMQLRPAGTPAGVRL